MFKKIVIKESQIIKIKIIKMVRKMGIMIMIKMKEKKKMKMKILCVKFVMMGRQKMMI